MPVLKKNKKYCGDSSSSVIIIIGPGSTFLHLNWILCKLHYCTAETGVLYMAPTAKENTEGASNENTLTCIYTRAV